MCVCVCVCACACACVYVCVIGKSSLGDLSRRLGTNICTDGTGVPGAAGGCGRFFGLKEFDEKNQRRNL